MAETSKKDDSKLDVKPDDTKLNPNESTDDIDGKYLRGHEGYKKWYGTPKLRSRLRSKSPSSSPKHMTADGKYLKGHAGYEKSYGNPGAPDPNDNTGQSGQNRLSRTLDKSPKLPKSTGYQPKQ